MLLEMPRGQRRFRASEKQDANYVRSGMMLLRGRCSCGSPPAHADYRSVAEGSSRVNGTADARLHAVLQPAPSSQREESRAR